MIFQQFLESLTNKYYYVKLNRYASTATPIYIFKMKKTQFGNYQIFYKLLSDGQRICKCTVYTNQIKWLDSLRPIEGAELDELKLEYL